MAKQIIADENTTTLKYDYSTYQQLRFRFGKQANITAAKRLTTNEDNYTI